MRRECQIGASEIVLVLPITIERLGRDAGAEPAGRCAEDARQRFAAAACGGECVPRILLVEFGNGAGGAVEQHDLVRKGVAENAGYAQCHVDARMVEQRGRDDLEADDAGRRCVPSRAHAHQRQRMGHIFAAGAQGGGRPQVHDDTARIIALVLEVPADHFSGSARAQGRGGAGRDGARIEGRQIAARGHHVAPPARGRPCRSRNDEAAVEGPEQALPLAGGAGCKLAAAFAENMQPVPDHDLAKIAQMGVEERQCLVDGGVDVDADNRRKAATLGAIDRSRARPDPARRGSRICAEEYSSTSSRMTAMSSDSSAAATAGVIWPMVIPLNRRFAGAASPGSSTMKG